MLSDGTTIDEKTQKSGKSRKKQKAAENKKPDKKT